MSYREEVQKYYKVRRAEGIRPHQALCVAKNEAKYTKGWKLRVLPSQHDAYDGVQRTNLPNGWHYTVEFQRDDNSGTPWGDSDCHGVISKHEHSRREYDDDWLLYSDRGSYRYYERDASLEKAIKMWGVAPDKAMASIKADYEVLRRWYNDDWWYVGVIVKLFDDENKELAEESCWDRQSDDILYLCSDARSWAADMILEERKLRRVAKRQEKISSRFTEAMECGL